MPAIGDLDKMDPSAGAALPRSPRIFDGSNVCHDCTRFQRGAIASAIAPYVETGVQDHQIRVSNCPAMSLVVSSAIFRRLTASRVSSVRAHAIIVLARLSRRITCDGRTNKPDPDKSDTVEH